MGTELCHPDPSIPGRGPLSRIDRFLSVLISRGGMILRLIPGEPPIMELPGGHRTTLSAQELLGTVLDGLAKEILPEQLQTSYLRGERVDFDYVLEGNLFEVVCTRSPFGTQVIIARISEGEAHVEGGSSLPESASRPHGPIQPLGAGDLDPYLRALLGAGASDLYLCGDEAPVLRKDGVVSCSTGLPPLPAKRLEELLRPLLPPHGLEALQAGRDTEAAFLPKDLPCRLRLRVVQDHKGPSLAVRAIPMQVPDAVTLGLSDAVQRLANLNRGLVLLAGPAGSGRTTTQACLLDLAHHHRHAFIVTLQDSVEFAHGAGSGLVRQREVGRDPERHHRALRAALQQTPDILAVGTIRDATIADLTLQAAQSGRLVFAQVNASSAVDAIYSLIDLFPEEQRSWIQNRLADQLKAVVVQTLIGRRGGGRVAAFETLFNNPSIAERIRDGRLEQIPAAMRSGRYGQVTHNDALLKLIQDGLVDPMDAWLRCQDRDSFIGACRKAGLDFDPRGSGEITEA